MAANGDRKRKSVNLEENLEESLEAKLMDILKKANGSIKLATLVLDRHSFPHTVDNLFALSMLVKQGHAEVTVSEDQTSFVAPRTRSEGETLDAQFVYRCDIKDWELMKTRVKEGEELMEQKLENENGPLTWSLKGTRKKARKKTAWNITAGPSKYGQVICQLNTSSLDDLYFETDEETISEDLNEEPMVDISGFDSIIHPSDDQVQGCLNSEADRSDELYRNTLLADSFLRQESDQDGGFQRVNEDSQCLTSSDINKPVDDLGSQEVVKREISDELFPKPRTPRLLTYSRRAPKQEPEVPQTTIEMIKHYTKQALNSRPGVVVIGIPKKKRTKGCTRLRKTIVPKKNKAIDAPKVEEKIEAPATPDSKTSSENKDACIMLKRFKRFKNQKTARKLKPRQVLIAQVKARLKAIFKAKG